MDDFMRNRKTMAKQENTIPLLCGAKRTTAVNVIPPPVGRAGGEIDGSQLLFELGICNARAFHVRAQHLSESPERTAQQSQSQCLSLLKCLYLKSITFSPAKACGRRHRANEP